MRRGIWILALGLMIAGAVGVSAQTSPAANLPGEPPTPASLANELTKSLDWLQKAKRLYVWYEFDDMPAKPGAEAATRPAALAPGPSQPARTKARDALIVALNGEKFFLLNRATYLPRVYTWDGKVAVSSHKEDYFEKSATRADIKPLFLLRELWGHDGPSSAGGSPGAPEELINFVRGSAIKGTEKFHGVDCYVLKNDHMSPLANLGVRGGERPAPTPAEIVTSYIGVADHRLYGFSENFKLNWFTDYVEVAPGDWLPSVYGVALQHAADAAPEEMYRLRLKEAKVEQPLPEMLFDQVIPEGAHVHDTLDGITLDYVLATQRSQAEWDEMHANAARSAVYGPPPLDTSHGIMLGSRADPLPLNPLALKPAADFPDKAQWLNGKAQRLADLRGKVTLIVFWATWQDWSGRSWPRQTPPPDYQLTAELQKDVTVIGVHVPTTELERVKKSIEEHGFKFPVCIDVPLDKGGWGTMADQYRLDQLPTVYVIDQTGNVAARGDWPEALRRAGELLPKPAAATGKAAP